MENRSHRYDINKPRPRHGYRFTINLKCVYCIMMVIFKQHLKDLPSTFLLVCFSSLKDSTCETWKNVFYFSSKALSVLEKIKF